MNEEFNTCYIEKTMIRNSSFYTLSWLISCLVAFPFVIPEKVAAQVILNDTSLSTLFGDVPPDPDYILSSNSSFVDFIFSEEGGGSVSIEFLSIFGLTGIYEIGSMENFDLNFVQNNTPLSINDGTVDSGTFNVQEGGSVLLAYFYDESSLSPESNPFGLDPTDSFSWAEITRTNGELELVGSATAVGGGIVSGTAIQLPEPSSLCFLVIAATGIFFPRRRSV